MLAANPFADHLRAELDRIQSEPDRLAARRRLIEELVSLESGREQQPAANRPRLPRGLITSKICEFLGRQREPVHATAILAYLEQHEAAPRSAKPLARLQSRLQRL